MTEQGTMLGFWVGEDEVVRGLRERPGPPGPVERGRDGVLVSGRLGRPKEA